MQRQWYRIHLNEPVILSASSTTEGAHRTLDFIPGRVLLGIAAGELYADLGDEAWRAFHSGDIRYVDGLPESDDGAPSVPMPMSLHHHKRSDDETVYNHARRRDKSREPDVQYVQLRSGWIGVDGDHRPQRFSVRRTSTIKTAVDTSDGVTPKEGHLFEYEAIGAGQSFIARIDAGDDVDAELLEAIDDAITGERRIGRSRSAEFGAVTIEPIDAPATEGYEASPKRSDYVNVVLVTDLAVGTDNAGLRQFPPPPSEFGLPDDWTLDLDHSFIRHRTYDRFNGYRSSFDIQRQVLRRGSVLTFEASDTPIDVDDVKARMERGAGVDRQEGLGQFIVHPRWLDRPELTPEQVPSDGEERSAASGSPPDAGLAAALERRAPRLAPDQRRAVRDDAKKIAAFCTNNDRSTPGPSQWSRIRSWASTAELTDRNIRQLVGGTTGQLSRGWQTKYGGEELGSFVLQYGQENGRAQLIELAHLVRRNILQQRNEETT